jgi:hypothetical protein
VRAASWRPDSSAFWPPSIHFAWVRRNITNKIPGRFAQKGGAIPAISIIVA